MKHMPFNISALLITSILLLGSSCKEDDQSPLEQLPPASKEGLNTFGCLVNGKLWLPKGRPTLFQPNFYLTYEPNYAGGTLDIRAYRNLKDVEEFIQLGSGYIDKVDTYFLDDPEISLAIYENPTCYYKSTEQAKIYDCKLEITKLDLETGIIAGKFEFTLAKQGCDTIRVTEGRFDYQLR